MNTINTKGLMLGMLAIGGLIAGGAMFQGQAYAQLPPLPALIEINPINAAAASNSDDDTVTQVNSATVKQESETKCEAKVSDDDKFQVGDNVNAAANDCDTTQTANVGQANVNTDNDIQVAEATSCQALGLIAGINICDNAVLVEVLENGIVE
jgi:hypothetical protein